MTLESGSEETGKRAENEQGTPRKVGSAAGFPYQAYRHADKNEQVIKIVANRLQPAAELGFLKFQTGNFPVASVKNAREPGQNRAGQHMPVTAQRKEDACCEADTECEQADHFGGDGKSNDLRADWNGTPSVRSRKNPVCGLDEPVIQLMFGRQALALGEDLLPLVFRYQVALHQGIRGEPIVQFLER